MDLGKELYWLHQGQNTMLKEIAVKNSSFKTLKEFNSQYSLIKHGFIEYFLDVPDGELSFGSGSQ